MRRQSAVSIFVVLLLFLGVFFVIKGNERMEPLDQSTSWEKSAQVLSGSYGSLTYAMPEAGQPLSGIQAPSIVKGVMNSLAQRRNQPGFLGRVASIMCALFTAFFENMRSSLYSLLLICLGFAGYHISQIKILHQMDGKKRIFTI